MPTDFRISRLEVAGLEEAAYFWALVAPTWPSDESEDTPEHLDRATPGQRALYATMLIARLVDNGGLEQTLWNMEPWFIDQAIEGFERFGADQHAGAVREAILAFFGEAPTRDLEKRRRLIDSKSREWREEFIEPLNEQLYGEDRLRPYWRRYLNSHESEFFRD